MAEPAVTGFFKRFAVKFVEVIGAGVATALSGYLLAHFSGYWSSPASTPPTVQVAPNIGAGANTSTSIVPKSQRIQPAHAASTDAKDQHVTTANRSIVRPARAVVSTKEVNGKEASAKEASAKRTVPKSSVPKKSAPASPRLRANRCRRKSLSLTVNRATKKRLRSRFAPPSPTSTQTARRRPRSCRDQAVRHRCRRLPQLNRSLPTARPHRRPSRPFRPLPKQRLRRRRRPGWSPNRLLRSRSNHIRSQRLTHRRR